MKLVKRTEYLNSRPLRPICCKFRTHSHTCTEI